MEKTFIVDINGELYKFLGYSFAECLYEAIEKHIEDNKEFAEYIMVTNTGDASFCKLIYSPAILCAYDVIDRSELYTFLVKSAVSDISKVV